MAYDKPKRQTKKTRRLISSSENDKYLKRDKLSKILKERNRNQKTFSSQHSIDDIKKRLNEGKKLFDCTFMPAVK